MNEMEIICPCCGHLFVVASVPVIDYADYDSAETIALASELGVEIGTLKGGEEIGD